MSRSVTKPLGASSSVRKSRTTANMTMAAPTDAAFDPRSFDVSAIGWGNLEQKFYELKAMLSAPTSGLNANQARVQQKQAVSLAIGKLLDTAQQECRRLLIEGNAKAAVEGGLKTLKLKEEYYGTTSLQLVPAYFHLARTNQFMDKFKNAEEFLSLAQWIILRHPEADVSLKAELHQTFGLLYASDSKLDAALKQLTCATYYLCAMNGPEHILTSFGYFDLGNVFAAKSNMENAMAFYDRVKESWYQHLSRVLRENAANPEGSDAPYATPLQFGEENLQDAVKMLRGIVALQTERYGRVHPSTARAEEVLGMFMLWNGDAVSALNSLLRALEISKRVYGERHPICGEIRSLLLTYGLQVPDDTSSALEVGGAAEPVTQGLSNAESVPRPGAGSVDPAADSVAGAAAAQQQQDEEEEFPMPPPGAPSGPDAPDAADEGVDEPVQDADATAAEEQQEEENPSSAGASPLIDSSAAPSSPLDENANGTADAEQPGAEEPAVEPAVEAAGVTEDAADVPPLDADAAPEAAEQQ